MLTKQSLFGRLEGEGRESLPSGCDYLSISVLASRNDAAFRSLAGRRRRMSCASNSFGCPGLAAKGRRNRLIAISQLPRRQREVPLSAFPSFPEGVVQKFSVVRLLSLPSQLLWSLSQASFRQILRARKRSAPRAARRSRRRTIYWVSPACRAYGPSCRFRSERPSSVAGRRRRGKSNGPARRCNIATAVHG